MHKLCTISRLNVLSPYLWEKLRKNTVKGEGGLRHLRKNDEYKGHVLDFSYYMDINRYFHS